MDPEFSFDNFPIHDLFHFQILSMIFPMNFHDNSFSESSHLYYNPGPELQPWPRTTTYSDNLAQVLIIKIHWNY